MSCCNVIRGELISMPSPLRWVTFIIYGSDDPMTAYGCANLNRHLLPTVPFARVIIITQRRGIRSCLGGPVGSSMTAFHPLFLSLYLRKFRAAAKFTRPGPLLPWGLSYNRRRFSFFLFFFLSLPRAALRREDM